MRFHPQGDDWWIWCRSSLFILQAFGHEDAWRLDVRPNHHHSVSKQEASTRAFPSTVPFSTPIPLKNSRNHKNARRQCRLIRVTVDLETSHARPKLLQRMKGFNKQAAAAGGRRLIVSTAHDHGVRSGLTQGVSTCGCVAGCFSRPVSTGLVHIRWLERVLATLTLSDSTFCRTVDPRGRGCIIYASIREALAKARVKPSYQGTTDDCTSTLGSSAAVCDVVCFTERSTFSSRLRGRIRLRLYGGRVPQEEHMIRRR